MQKNEAACKASSCCHWNPDAGSGFGGSGFGGSGFASGSSGSGFGGSGFGGSGSGFGGTVPPGTMPPGMPSIGVHMQAFPPNDIRCWSSIQRQKCPDASALGSAYCSDPNYKWSSAGSPGLPPPSGFTRDSTFGEICQDACDRMFPPKCPEPAKQNPDVCKQANISLNEKPLAQGGAQSAKGQAYTGHLILRVEFDSSDQFDDYSIRAVPISGQVQPVEDNNARLKVKDSGRFILEVVHGTKGCETKVCSLVDNLELDMPICARGTEMKTDETGRKQCIKCEKSKYGLTPVCHLCVSGGDCALGGTSIVTKPGWWRGQASLESLFLC